MTDSAHPLGFAPANDTAIRYMDRTRDWYLALGYGNPYRWANFSEVPFQPLSPPLAQSRVALVTTAAPFQPDKGPQGPGAPYNAAAKFYEVYSGDSHGDPDVRISHVNIDRDHTSMEDANSWFPLQALRRAQASGRIGALTPSFHGLPTNRSQRHTLTVDCPELLRRCQAEATDVAVLVPNCPVCHQSISLVARHLEAHGIATVILGCAKDIVEYCGVPRFVFSDFPLGNGAGKPHDVGSQDEVLELGFALLEHAFAPRTTVQNPQRWCDNPAWKQDYCNPERYSAEELRAKRAENDHIKTVAQARRDAAV